MLVDPNSNKGFIIFSCSFSQTWPLLFNWNRVTQCCQGHSRGRYTEKRKVLFITPTVEQHVRIKVFHQLWKICVVLNTTIFKVLDFFLTHLDMLCLHGWWNILAVWKFCNVKNECNICILSILYSIVVNYLFCYAQVLLASYREIATKTYML